MTYVIYKQSSKSMVYGTFYIYTQTWQQQRASSDNAN